MIRYLEINPDEIPAKKIFNLSGQDYILFFQFNKFGNFFTVQVSKDDEILYIGKIQYGNFLIQFIEDIDFILPISEKDFSSEGYQNLRVDKTNLGSSIFLYYEDGL